MDKWHIIGHVFGFLNVTQCCGIMRCCKSFNNRGRLFFTKKPKLTNDNVLGLLSLNRHCSTYKQECIEYLKNIDSTQFPDHWKRVFWFAIMNQDITLDSVFRDRICYSPFYKEAFQRWLRQSTPEFLADEWREAPTVPICDLNRGNFCEARDRREAWYCVWIRFRYEHYVFVHYFGFTLRIYDEWISVNSDRLAPKGSRYISGTEWFRLYHEPLESH